jgi:hypothetical protein
LIGARSQRTHHGTLLQYVAANGIENFRQKTPENIVQIAKLLLDAGADVNAECAAYGGGAVVLLLAATSVHPERAGMQEQLLQLLLDYGARMGIMARAWKDPQAAQTRSSRAVCRMAAARPPDFLRRGARRSTWKLRQDLVGSMWSGLILTRTER